MFLYLRGEIKFWNICIVLDFINFGFLLIGKKNCLGVYNKKEGLGSVVIVFCCNCSLKIVLGRDMKFFSLFWFLKLLDVYL